MIGFVGGPVLVGGLGDFLAPALKSGPAYRCTKSGSNIV